MPRAFKRPAKNLVVVVVVVVRTPTPNNLRQASPDRGFGGSTYLEHISGVSGWCQHSAPHDMGLRARANTARYRYGAVCNPTSVFVTTSSSCSPSANTARLKEYPLRVASSGTLWCGGLMWGPATFVLGLISLVQAQADSRGQLTVCIVEAYNLENLDADEPFGGSASDPCAACCATSAPRS